MPIELHVNKAIDLGYQVIVTSNGFVRTMKHRLTGVYVYHGTTEMRRIINSAYSRYLASNDQHNFAEA